MTFIGFAGQAPALQSDLSGTLVYRLQTWSVRPCCWRLPSQSTVKHVPHCADGLPDKCLLHHFAATAAIASS